MHITKDVSIFLLKAFGFVVVFWLSWIFIFRPISALNSQPSIASDIQEKQQFETYSQQLEKANAQLSESAIQQKRMDALLSQYEQQAKRYDAVLQKWEQQTGVRK